MKITGWVITGVFVWWVIILLSDPTNSPEWDSPVSADTTMLPAVALPSPEIVPPAPPEDRYAVTSKLAEEAEKCPDPNHTQIRRLLKSHPEWTNKEIATIACDFVTLGMSETQAVEAWGRPNDINRTTFSGGVHEQWVYGEYGGNYLYFEDGILTSIQN